MKHPELHRHSGTRGCRNIMNLNSHHRRLCRLVNTSIRRYTDLAPSSVTPEIAKDILISLSQVYTIIRSWTVGFDADSCSHSQSGSDHEAPEDHCSDVLNSGHYGHECMASIFGCLMSLLSLPNQYIQHLTSNALVTVFECDIAYENGGEEFLHLMCLCLKMAISKAVPPTAGSIPMEAHMLVFEASDPVLFQKLKLESANSLTVASIIRVLRNMLKLVQLNPNRKVLKLYLDFVTDSISSLFMLNEACGVSNRKRSSGSVDHGFINEDADQEKTVTVLQGNLLQLLCSLVDASSSSAGAGCCEYRVIYDIRDVIPKLLALYVDKPENVGDVRISEYLRHKILMLMLRLSSVCNLEHSVLISWLHLINENFHDLLSQSIEVMEYYSKTCLEGSPFGTGRFEAETRRISSRHLQRLAVLLFLRCSLTSLSMKEKADEHFEFSGLGKSLSSSLNGNLECPPSIKGLLELNKWLQSHLPRAIDANDGLYFGRCLSFVSSFLQLYMHEDDLLFQMLLQTLCLPFYSRQLAGRGVSPLAAKGDIFCLVSFVFNPVNLFHLFLAAIFYDHRVLLDYLISNDTGARCAEYLLKCLRMVCDEWNLFVEFPALFESLCHPCRKRRRVLEGDLDLEDNCCFSDLGDDSIPSPLQVLSKKGHKLGRKHGEAMIVSFVDAKDCLSSLKACIVSLHRKNLFPYNPQVLVRRLSKFEEACLKQIDRC